MHTINYLCLLIISLIAANGFIVYDASDNVVNQKTLLYAMNGTKSTLSQCRTNTNDNDMEIIHKCVDNANTANSDIVFGVSYSNMAMFVGSAMKNTPTIALSTATVLKDRVTYPMTFLPLSIDPVQGYVISLLCKHYGWERVAVLVSVGQETEVLADYISSSNKQFGIDTDPKTYTTGEDPTRQLMALKDLGTYIFILAIAYQDANNVLEVVNKLGLNVAPYVIIISFQLQRVFLADGVLTTRAKSILHGSIGVMPGTFNQDRYDEYIATISRLFKIYVAPQSLGVGLGYFFDAQMQTRKGFDLYSQLAPANNCSNTTTGRISRCVQILKNALKISTYDGIFGVTSYDDNFLRQGGWTIYNNIATELRNGNVTYVQNPIGTIITTENTTELLRTGNLNINPIDLQNIQIYGSLQLPTFMGDNSSNACNKVNNPFHLNRSDIPCNVVWPLGTTGTPVAYARLMVNESIKWNFNAIYILLATAISVLTAWIGKMLVHRQIYSAVVDKKHPESPMWIILPSMVLAIGSWSSLIMIPASITIKSVPIVDISFGQSEFLLPAILMSIAWIITNYIAFTNPYTDYKTDILISLPETTSGVKKMVGKQHISFKRFLVWSGIGCIAALGTIGAYFIVNSGIKLPANKIYSTTDTTLSIITSVVVHMLSINTLFYAKISTLKSIIIVAWMPIVQSLISTTGETFIFTNNASKSDGFASITILIIGCTVFIVLAFITFFIHIRKLKLSAEAYEIIVEKLKAEKKEIVLDNNELMRRQLIAKFEQYAHHAVSLDESEGPVATLLANIIYILKTTRIAVYKNSSTTNSDLTTNTRTVADTSVDEKQDNVVGGSVQQNVIVELGALKTPTKAFTSQKPSTLVQAPNDKHAHLSILDSLVQSNITQHSPAIAPSSSSQQSPNFGKSAHLSFIDKHTTPSFSGQSLNTLQDSPSSPDILTESPSQQGMRANSFTQQGAQQKTAIITRRQTNNPPPLPFSTNLAKYRLGLDNVKSRVSDMPAKVSETKLADELKEVKFEFKEIVHVNRCIEALKKLANKTYCQENIHHLFAIECYECAYDINAAYPEYKLDLVRIAQTIFFDYIDTGNISADMKKSYSDRLKNPIITSNLFYELKTELLKLLKDNLHTSFFEKYTREQGTSDALMCAGLIQLKR